jgi:hypothetical protein
LYLGFRVSGYPFGILDLGLLVANLRYKRGNQKPLIKDTKGVFGNHKSKIQKRSSEALNLRYHRSNQKLAPLVY